MYEIRKIESLTELRNRLDASDKKEQEKPLTRRRLLVRILLGSLAVPVAAQSKNVFADGGNECDPPQNTSCDPNACNPNTCNQNTCLSVNSCLQQDTCTTNVCVQKDECKMGDTCSHDKCQSEDICWSVNSCGVDHCDTDKCIGIDTSMDHACQTTDHPCGQADQHCSFCNAGYDLV